MRSSDRRLADDVCLLDDILLIDRNHLGRYFHAEIAAGNHDAISSFQNGIDVVIAFLVLDLRDDLDLRFSFFNQNLADLVDIACPAGEGSEDEIDIILAAEAQVCFILCRKERHRKLDTRHVAALAGADRSVDFDTALELIAVILENGEPHLSVVDQDIVVRLQIIKELRAVDMETLMRSFDLGFLHIDNLAFVIFLDIILEDAAADFRSLGIQRNGQIDSARIADFTDSLDSLEVLFMRTMREIHAGNIHAGISKLEERILVFACRADGADYFRFLE